MLKSCTLKIYCSISRFSKAQIKLFSTNSTWFLHIVFPTSKNKSKRHLFSMLTDIKNTLSGARIKVLRRLFSVHEWWPSDVFTGFGHLFNFRHRCLKNFLCFLKFLHHILLHAFKLSLGLRSCMRCSLPGELFIGFIKYCSMLVHPAFISSANVQLKQPNMSCTEAGN